MSDEIVKIPGIRKLQNGMFASSLRSDSPVVEKPEMTEKQAALMAALESDMATDDIRRRLRPQPEDYAPFAFRALSQKYLGEGGYFLDFSKKNILEASLPHMKLEANGGTRRSVLTFVANHSRDVNSVIGRVDDAYFSKKDKRMTAPGINAEVGIDIMLGFRQIRQLSADPPLLDSVSVWVMYDWEKSHAEMDDWDFLTLLGRDVDGEVVRLVVTEIYGYGHLALVDEGGDVEADALENQYGVALQASKKTVVLPVAGGGDTSKNNGGGKTMELSEILQDRLKGILKLEKMDADGLVAEVLKVTDKLAKAEFELESIRAKAKLYDDRLETERKEIKDLAQKAEGDDGKSLHRAIEKMDFTELAAMRERFNKKLETMYGSGRSSQDDKLGDEGGKPAPKEQVDVSAYKTGAAAL